MTHNLQTRRSRLRIAVVIILGFLLVTILPKPEAHARWGAAGKIANQFFKRVSIWWDVPVKIPIETGGKEVAKILVEELMKKVWTEYSEYSECNILSIDAEIHPSCEILLTDLDSGKIDVPIGQIEAFRGLLDDRRPIKCPTKRRVFSCEIDEREGSNVDWVLRKIIPCTPQERSRKIPQWVSRLAAGDSSRRETRLVPPEDHEALAIFLALALKRSPESEGQRRLIDAVMEISRRPDGKTQLIDPENPQTFWKLLAEEMNEGLLRKWAVFLEETSKKAKQEDMSKREAFCSILSGTDRFSKLPCLEKYGWALTESESISGIVVCP